MGGRHQSSRPGEAVTRPIVNGPTAFDLALEYVARQLAKGPQASAWLQRDRPARVTGDANGRFA